MRAGGVAPSRTEVLVGYTVPVLNSPPLNVVWHGQVPNLRSSLTWLASFTLHCDSMRPHSTQLAQPPWHPPAAPPQNSLLQFILWIFSKSLRDSQTSNKQHWAFGCFVTLAKQTRAQHKRWMTSTCIIIPSSGPKPGINNFRLCLECSFNYVAMKLAQVAAQVVTKHKSLCSVHEEPASWAKAAADLGLYQWSIHMDLIDIFRTFQPNSRMYILFNCNGTFSGVDHMLDYKKGLNKFENIEIISSIYFYYNGMKLKINHKKKPGKYTNT